MPDKKIPWQYCECGCQQDEFRIGSFGFGLYRAREKYYVRSDCRPHPSFEAPTKGFTSQNEADAYVVECLKKNSEEMKKDIAIIEAFLES